MKQSVKTTPHTGTGVQGADMILNGRLIRDHSYLLSGVAGCGKTIFSLQWLRDGLANGETCMYITLAEPANEIAANVIAFGWNLDGVDVIDLSPSGENLDEYHVFAPNEVEGTPVWKAIYQAIQDKKPGRLVIDSVTNLRYLAADEYQFRKNILALVNLLKRSGGTSLLLFDPSEEQLEVTVGLAVDGIIRLQREISPSLAIGVRSMQVEKMRGSNFLSSPHALRIGASGITVFPHIIETTEQSAPGDRLIASGVAALDELLGGGFTEGTINLISGPTGAGKSSLGTQFLVHQAAHTRAVLFSFEESPAMIIARSRSMGSPIEEALTSGALEIRRINPLELYPDEFLAVIRKAVEEDGRRLVMIDSLRGYELAMEDFGKPLAHIHNLTAYLSRKGVSTLLINETEFITGLSLRATDISISIRHLADNIIQLRYAEMLGRVAKVVGCLKKRAGSFQPELREMSTTANGICVGQKLKNMQGLLTGTPTILRAA